MAAWQVMIGATVGHPLPGGWRAWSGYPSLQQSLTDLFGEGRVDYADWWRWGDDDRNDAQIHLTDESGSFIFRLDAREDFRAFIQKLAPVFRDLGLMIRLRDGQPFVPDEARLIEIVETSHAYGY